MVKNGRLPHVLGSWSSMNSCLDCQIKQEHLQQQDNQTDNSEMPRKKKFEAFTVNLNSQNETSLQNAFLKFKKQKQMEIQVKKKKKKRTPKQMNELRRRFMQQVKKYYGVPYAKKYWSENTLEYKSPLFLDCCGLVRRVMRDLEDDFGFRLGPWNQAYMYDTLPINIYKEEDMKPGDLVFMSGIYTNPKAKQQRHLMTHVEIWAGDGPKTIGARWNNGKVQMFDHYKFTAKSFHSERYYFKSIDSWLKGVCKSYCSKHKWKIKKFNPSKKSIFNTKDQIDQTEKQTPADTEYSEEAAADGQNITDSDDSDSSVNGEQIENEQDSDSSDELSNQNIPPLLEDTISSASIELEKSSPDSTMDLENIRQTEILSESRGGLDGDQIVHDEDNTSINVMIESPKRMPEKYWVDVRGVSETPKLTLTHSKTFTTDYRSEGVTPVDSDKIKEAINRIQNSSLVTDSYAPVNSNKKKNVKNSLPTDSEKWCEATSRRMLFTQKLKSLKYRSSVAPNCTSSKHSTFSHLPPGPVRRSKTVCDMKKKAIPTLTPTPTPKPSLAPATFIPFRADCERTRPSRPSADSRWINSACVQGKAFTQCKSKTNIPHVRSYDSFSGLGKKLSKTAPPVFPVKCHSAPQLLMEEPSDAKTDLCQRFYELDINCPDCLDSTADHHETDMSKMNKESPFTDNSEKASLSDQAQDECSNSEPCDSETNDTGETMQNTTGNTESDQLSENHGEDNSGDAGKGSRRGGRKGSPNGKASKLPGCVLPNNMQPTFYIGGGNGAALVEGPLLALGWKRTVDKFDERFKLKWVECKSRINYSAFREGEQLVNHIPNCNLLTNKLGLINSLQEYERVTICTKGRPPRLQTTDFHPETYRLDEKTDREVFLQQYKDNETWICKPTGMNQGKGIFLIRSREELMKLLEERDQQKGKQKAGRPMMARIVQRYIHSPLLLEGRKFDIRAYMLIASTVPYLVLFHQGYIRLSCNKYNGEDSNLITHLTNQYIQKKDPQYKDVKEDTAWSMKRFNDYINEHVAQERGMEPNWVFSTLTKQMQKIMIHCFNSVKHKMQTRVGYFDLYGLDFMIDTDMKVWLIEININPALSTNCEALKETIPSVIEECLHICIECFEKSKKNYPLMPLKSLKTFTILYCGTRLNAVPSRQSRSVSPLKDGLGTGEKSRTTIFPLIRRTSPTRQPPNQSVAKTATIQNSVTRKHEATPSATLTTSEMSDSSASDDVKLKMTHATPSAKRTRQKQDRGN